MKSAKKMYGGNLPCFPDEADIPLTPEERKKVLSILSKTFFSNQLKRRLL